MWLERYTIVVPSLSHTRLPYPVGVYSPSWVEMSLMAGCFAAFILLYIMFSKVFPIVSIWEVQEGIEESVGEVSERVRSYYAKEDEDD